MENIYVVDICDKVGLYHPSFKYLRVSGTTTATNKEQESLQEPTNALFLIFKPKEVILIAPRYRHGS